MLTLFLEDCLIFISPSTMSEIHRTPCAATKLQLIYWIVFDVMGLFWYKIKEKIVGFHFVYVLSHLHFSMTLISNNKSLLKVLCLTGWSITLSSDPVSTVGSSLELHGLDWYQAKLRSTVCVSCMLTARTKSTMLRVCKHCFTARQWCLHLGICKHKK